MKTKRLFYGSSIAAGIVLLGVGFYFWGYINLLIWPPKLPLGKANVSNGVATEYKGAAQSDKLVKQAITGFVDNLKAAGFREAPSASTALAEAVKTRDQGNILRAFSRAIYSQSAKMSEIVPILKGYLNDPDPFVRLNAAQDLLIAGDLSGVDTLTALVKAAAPISGIGKDVRVSAAELLAQYQVTEATSAISDLFDRTQTGELLDALSRLRAQASNENEFPYVASNNTILEYGEIGITRFIPQITLSFQNSRDLSVKVAAAWALATMTGNKDAVDYLTNAANQVATGGVVLDGSDAALDIYTADQQALEYLGTIHTSAAKQVLETALTSRNQTEMTIAEVNLIVNQGGSDAATKLLVNQLRETSPQNQQIGWDEALSLAAQLPDSQQIQNAGQVYSQKSGDGSWELYTVERKKWPVYNWVWSYVIEVKK
jgi:HEAT repeat protein